MTNVRYYWSVSFQWKNLQSSKIICIRFFFPGRTSDEDSSLTTKHAHNLLSLCMYIANYLCKRVLTIRNREITAWIVCRSTNSLVLSGRWFLFFLFFNINVFILIGGQLLYYSDFATHWHESAMGRRWFLTYFTD